MSRAVTLTEVAKAAGVSLSTASLAFSGAGPISAATKAKVLKAASSLGYRGPNPVAASLRRGRSGVVGIIIDNALRYSFRDPVSVQTLDGIATVLGAHGYGVLLVPKDDPAGGLSPLLRHAAMDAAIVFHQVMPRDPVLKVLRDRGLPVVSLTGRARGVTTVSVPNREGMRLLGEHLVERGRSRVAFATLPWTGAARRGFVDPATEPTSPVTQERYLGLLDAGIEPIAVWECRGSLVDEGITAGHALLDHAPDAIVGFSDLIAAGALLAARERGLDVPGDVAVAGFDGVDLPWLSDARLTTIDQPRLDKGKVVAEAAIALATGQKARSQELDVHLVLGSTT